MIYTTTFCWTFSLMVYVKHMSQNVRRASMQAASVGICLRHTVTLPCLFLSRIHDENGRFTTRKLQTAKGFTCGLLWLAWCLALECSVAETIKGLLGLESGHWPWEPSWRHTLDLKIPNIDNCELWKLVKNWIDKNVSTNWFDKVTLPVWTDKIYMLWVKLTKQCVWKLF